MPHKHSELNPYILINISDIKMCKNLQKHVYQHQNETCNGRRPIGSDKHKIQTLSTATSKKILSDIALDIKANDLKKSWLKYSYFWVSCP